MARGARISLGPSAARALVQARRLGRAAQRTAAALERLPKKEGLELEVAKKAVALGVDVVQLALKPNVLQAVKTALRTADFVRSLAREDRGMER